MAANARALRAGDLDAVQLFQPTAEELLADGEFSIWMAAAERGLTAYTTLVARRATLAAKRDEMAAMVRAVGRTLRWLADAPGAEVARVVAPWFPDVPAPLFARAIDRYKSLGLFGPDPVTRREGYERLVAAMVSGGALARAVPFEAAVDNSLAEAALRPPA